MINTALQKNLGCHVKIWPRRRNEHSFQAVRCYWIDFRSCFSKSRSAYFSI